MWIAGIAIYVRNTKPIDVIGRYGFWSLILLLTSIYVASIPSPPPANLRVVGWMALATWLIPLWAGWADAHRRWIASPDVRFAVHAGSSS